MTEEKSLSEQQEEQVTGGAARPFANSCPNCGSKESTETTENRMNGDEAIVVRIFTCRKCGKRWKRTLGGR